MTINKVARDRWRLLKRQKRLQKAKNRILMALTKSLPFLELFKNSISESPMARTVNKILLMVMKEVAHVRQFSYQHKHGKAERPQIKICLTERYDNV
jgi:hypothetical protein